MLQVVIPTPTLGPRVLLGLGLGFQGFANLLPLLELRMLCSPALPQEQKTSKPETQPPNPKPQIQAKALISELFK